MDLGIALASATAVANSLMVGVGVWQIKAVRRENKLERTLTACSRYEADPVVERHVATLRQARLDGSFKENPRQFEHAITIVLNYLDTLAIGIEQKLYDDDLAYDHTHSIIKVYLDNYLSGAVLVGFIDPADYTCLMELARRWEAKRKLMFGRKWHPFG